MKYMKPRIVRSVKGDISNSDYRNINPHLVRAAYVINEKVARCLQKAGMWGFYKAVCVVNVGGYC